MKKIEILVFGKHLDILQVVLRLINANPNWHAEGTTDAEEVIEKCQLNAYDLLLLGGGISQNEENKIRAILNKLRPELKIIQHFGGGSGLLSNEIQAALSGNQAANFNVMDNPFGHTLQKYTSTKLVCNISCAPIRSALYSSELFCIANQFVLSINQP